MKSRQGFILPTTLTFLVFFMSWSYVTLSGIHQYNVMRHYLETIETRITIEHLVFDRVRIDQEESISFVFSNYYVNAYVIDDILVINMSGNMEYYREYDIITDGSFVIR